MKKVEFEIQNFDCLGQNATYLVACEDGEPGFVKVAGKTISIDQSKRGHAAEATFAITGSDGVNTFTETFTLTFQHPKRFLQACADTVETPEPWLTIGTSQSVGNSNNIFKYAVHEGD